jgi:repressor LexA
LLTPRQRDLLAYIHGHVKEHGFCPSYREMGKAIGMGSTSGIHRLVTGLEERGFIRRLPRNWRAIEVIRGPLDGEAA